MTLNRLFAVLKQFVRCGGFLIPALLLWVMPAWASGPGPGGINIGFNFNWSPTTSPPGATGYTATFIASTSASGGTLNTCIGVCNFAIAYSVGGTPQPAVLPDGAYETWQSFAQPLRSCDTNNGTTSNNTSPLTLFDCFNQNSFGQDFTPTSTGLLSGMTMPMTCLNPAGTPLVGLSAVLYVVTGNTIPATPIASTPVNLSTCPTLTSWTGHTFTAGDFAPIPLNFTGVTLTAGTTYGVYFAGLVPGAQLPGAPTVTSVAPGTGPLTGGNTVTITGTGFTGATSVTFGGVDATSFTVVSATQISAVVPSSASVATVSVNVTTPSGTNNVNTLYSYVLPPPTVTSVNPGTGPLAGGNTVTITGTGFAGATSVTFGGVAATSFTVVSDTQISAVVPAGSAATATVSVNVTTPNGTNAANTLYAYAVPVPTLGEWGMICLIALLILYALVRLRRERGPAGAA